MRPSFLISHFSFLDSRFSILDSRFKATVSANFLLGDGTVEATLFPRSLREQVIGPLDRIFFLIWHRMPG
jgi:hypothetical protein